jgi:YbbR domain-containing protein
MFYHPFRHLGFKFLAVALSAGLWFAVAGEQTVERSLRVPLETRNTPEQLELVENPPSTVEVRVRGGADLLSHLSQSDLVAVIDLASARAGRRFFHLMRDQVRAPYGVEVMQIAPSTIALRFETSATHRIPVQPTIEGEPAPGFTVGAITIDPQSVEVTGPESALKALKEAITEPISIAGARGRIKESVNIGVADSSVRLRSSGTALVSVEIEATAEDYTVGHVPLRLRNAGRGASVEVVPSEVGVVTRGVRDQLQKLQAAGFVAYVDLAGLAPGRYNLPVRVEPPQGVTVVRAEPATVRVRIAR